MPASLSFDEHLRQLELAGERLADLAESTGLAAAVPTCPTWTVAHLVAHQAMVHRWAASHVRGEGGDARSQTDIREQEPDLLGYYRAGLSELLDAFGSAPPDLQAMTFLADAGSPLEFWARRQAHETTIHQVDAIAAAVGRFPVAADAEVTATVSDAVALDGLDELLRGFYTRGRSKLFDGTESRFLVAPTDSARRWLVHVAERLTVADEGEADASLSGTAVQLYLGLWNRGDEVVAHGDPELLARWRATQRVRWS